MDLHVKIDTDEFRRRMRGFEKDIPFAISMATMRTCSRSMDLIRGRLDDAFNIRNKWVAKGIRAWPENAIEARTFKKQIQAGGEATALVGSMDEFMFQQTEGYTDAAGRRKHGKTFAVPRVGQGLPRGTILETTPPKKWPGKLAQQRNTFVGVLRRGREEAVWRRVIRTDKDTVVSRRRTRPRAGEYAGVELLYVLTQDIKVPRKWPLEKQVTEAFAQNWPPAVIAAVVRAINTSTAK